MKESLTCYTQADWDGTFAYLSTTWTYSITVEGYGHSVEMGMLIKPTARQLRKMKKRMIKDLKGG